MPIKAEYGKKEDIPEEQKAFYTEKNDKWYLDVEGLPTKAEYDRLNSLINTERQSAEVLKKKLGSFEGVDMESIASLLAVQNELGDDFDPSRYKAALEELKTLKSSRSTDTATLQDQITELSRNKNQLLKETSSLKKKFEEASANEMKLQAKINMVDINSSFTEAANKLKIVPTAVSDVLMHAEKFFEKDINGKTVAKDGLPHILTGTTPEDYLISCQSTRPQWWAPSVGAGAVGAPGAASGAKNPWAKDSFSLTEQGKIYKEDPELARSFAKRRV